MYLFRSSFLLFLLAANPGTSFAPSFRQSRSIALSPLQAKDDTNNDELLAQVQTAERKVKSLNNLLTSLERRSTQDRLEWMKERTTLTHKISVLNELLRESTPVPVDINNNKDQSETIEALERDLAMAHEHEDLLSQEQERLEREVLILQDQIVMIRNLLKTEQYRSAELEEQLDEVQETQESESMRYQVQVEAQAREIEAMRAKLQFYEQHGPQPIYTAPPTNGIAPQNETLVAMM